ncbi:MAG: nucleotidyltransferase family protein [Acidobacteriota bacterium]|nr:nucleotidyltransferase family protein [Acidobacteriota bacterium]
MAVLPNNSSCPEKQLLVCCSRTRVDAPLADEIRPLLQSPLDWDFLIREAASNSVSPLLLRHICSIAPDRIPPAHLLRLKNHVRAASLRNLTLTAGLVRVLRALSAVGIQAIPYKGPVLATQAYGDIAAREFEDIDLVLRQRDMAAANDVLVRLDFSPDFPPVFLSATSSAMIPGEYNYRERERHLLLELHTERTLRHFPAPPDLDALSRRLATVSLSGCKIQTFSPEDTLVFICVHGSKDFWERLLWVADVAELIASHPRLDWDCVYAFADSVRARRMLNLGLALADRLLGAALPDVVRSRVRPDNVAALVASQVRIRLLSRAPTQLTAWAAFAYRRRSVPGAYHGFRYAMRLATAPAAEDWYTVRLPRPLAPLYAALRPFRLLRKYGA